MSEAGYVVVSRHLSQVGWSEDFYFWDKAAQLFNNEKKTHFVDYQSRGTKSVWQHPGS